MSSGNYQCGNGYDPPTLKGGGPPQPPSLRFVVFAAGGPPYHRISGARMSILDGPGGGRYCVTDAKGECSIRSIPVTTALPMTLAAVHPAYQRVERRVSLGAGYGAVLQSFELMPRE
jgi:hypothetical protein